ncbi:MAG: NDP-sugar synthase [Burkholderiaceae bacterium]
MTPPLAAMILAAGRGERMRPLTDHCPKPLLPAGGKPLIEWHLGALARAGVRDVVINHAHLGAMIEQALGDGSRWGLRLRYSPEAQALETAGGIAQALRWLGEGPFLVVNGDVHCGFDLGRARTIAQQMRVAGLLGWCVLVDNPAHHPNGDFELHDGLIAAEPDVPASAPGTLPADSPARLTPARLTPTHLTPTRLTFSGIGLYRAELFASVAAGTRAPLAPLLRHAALHGRLGGEYYGGTWTDVGTPQRLAELDAQLKRDSPR